MATADHWRELAAKVNAGDLDAIRAWYRTAIEEGRALIRRRNYKINAADYDDLIHDVLAKNQELLLHADSPRALFLQCLVNHVLDVLRKSRDVPLDDNTPEPSSESSPAASLDVQRALVEVTDGNPRDAKVFYAVVVAGEAPDVVAELFGLTRQNVYQIVSRAKKRLRESEES
jgi:DNA-directed RNA polymerase specialized sigma24 family protein